MRKALIVSREEEVTRACAEFLESIDFEAVVATDCQEAIDAFSRENFTFLLVRWDSPGFDELLDHPSCPPACLVGAPRYFTAAPTHRKRILILDLGEGPRVSAVAVSRFLNDHTIWHRYKPTGHLGPVKRKALIVCDDESKTLACVDSLFGIGFEAVAVKSGEAAIKVLSVQSFPFAIVQWHVSGFRELMRHKNCPPFVKLGGPSDFVWPQEYQILLSGSIQNLHELSAMLRRYLGDDTIVHDREWAFRPRELTRVALILADEERIVGRLPDEPELIPRLRALLGAVGFDAVVASSAEVALKILTERSAAFALIEIGAPGAATLAAHPLCPRPIALMPPPEIPPPPLPHGFPHDSVRMTRHGSPQTFAHNLRRCLNTNSISLVRDPENP